jgi:small subunit ribosomal protein S1
VVRLAPFGAFVEIEKGVEGLLHISELGQGRHIVSPREVLREGDEVAVRVLGFDAERRRISLGLAGDEDEEGTAEALEAVRESARRGAGGGHGLGTLGDLLRDALKK